MKHGVYNINAILDGATRLSTRSISLF